MVRRTLGARPLEAGREQMQVGMGRRLVGQGQPGQGLWGHCQDFGLYGSLAGGHLSVLGRVERRRLDLICV